MGICFLLPHPLLLFFSLYHDSLLRFRCDFNDGRFLRCFYCMHTARTKSETKWKYTYMWDMGRICENKNTCHINTYSRGAPIFSFWYLVEYLYQSSVSLFNTGTSHFRSELLCLATANIVNIERLTLTTKTFGIMANIFIMSMLTHIESWKTRIAGRYHIQKVLCIVCICYFCWMFASMPSNWIKYSNRYSHTKRYEFIHSVWFRLYPHSLKSISTSYFIDIKLICQQDKRRL